MSAKELPLPRRKLLLLKRKRYVALINNNIIIVYNPLTIPQQEASTPEPKTTPKIDITHNMFKLLDSKRVRKGSPLASPTIGPPNLTSSASTGNLLSRATLQSSPSLPTKFSSTNSILSPNSPILNGTPLAPIPADDTTLINNNNNNTNNNINNNNNNINNINSVVAKVTAITNVNSNRELKSTPTKMMNGTSSSPSSPATTSSSAYPVTPSHDTPQSNRSFPIKSPTTQT